jgi:hypothetical protein
VNSNLNLNSPSSVLVWNRKALEVAQDPKQTSPAYPFPLSWANPQPPFPFLPNPAQEPHRPSPSLSLPRGPSSTLSRGPVDPVLLPRSGPAPAHAAHPSAGPPLPVCLALHSGPARAALSPRLRSAALARVVSPPRCQARPTGQGHPLPHAGSLCWFRDRRRR